ncbi:MAG: glycosyltransferase [Rickettsiales bacterium]|jgi:glycosyltransferase involved in cell wall biosynthesis|nr:glycosyltransferase [Rickettsiales bacterium]
MTDLISIIIPVCNSEKFLKRCLASVVNQTYKNIEIICVNDGSTDSSLKILQQYAKKYKFIKIISQKNQGQSVARNVGLEKMNGKYVMFCDSDDTLEVDACECMLKTITDNNVDIVLCDCNIIIPQNMDSEIGKNLHVKKFGKFKLNQKSILNIPLALWSKIFKADIIKNNKISFPDNIRKSEDYYFIYTYLLSSNSIFFLKNKLYNYYIRENSVACFNQLKQKSIEPFVIAEYIYKFICKHNLFIQTKNAYPKIFLKLFGYGYKNLSDELKEKIIVSEANFLRKITHEFNFLNKEKFNAILSKDKDVINFYFDNSAKRYRLFGICIFKILTTDKYIYYVLFGKVVYRKLKV